MLSTINIVLGTVNLMIYFQTGSLLNLIPGILCLVIGLMSKSE